MEKMLDLFEEAVEVHDDPKAPDFVPKGGEVVFGEIVFRSCHKTVPLTTIVTENVSFAYDPRQPILKDISFRIEPGTTVALVGPSGGGQYYLSFLITKYFALLTLCTCRKINYFTSGKTAIPGVSDCWIVTLTLLFQFSSFASTIPAREEF
jgi:hypothetical protein